MQIKIACKAAMNLPVESLVEFQNELKTLSKENYEKLRAEIKDQGFSFPVAVWQNDGKNFILDGHQRIRTLKKMITDEGFTCPEVPVALVDAVDYKQAKHKLLAAMSQYGRVEPDGLYLYITESGIDPLELKTIEIRDFNLQDFAKSYFDVKLSEDGLNEKQSQGSKEITEEDLGEFDHSCPRCSFKFNCDIKTE